MLSAQLSMPAALQVPNTNALNKIPIFKSFSTEPLDDFPIKEANHMILRYIYLEQYDQLIKAMRLFNYIKILYL